MKGTSLNNTRSIKQGIIDKALAVLPSELHPTEFVIDWYLSTPLSDIDRLNHYLGNAKYRNNYKRK